MRDLLGWNLSLGRWAGIHVRLHVFFVLLVVVALELSWSADPQRELVWITASALTILFASVLLHELGHCLAARRMGGRADQIILWPLGGLVHVHVSHQPQEELVTALAGPLVNMFLCVASALGLLVMQGEPKEMLQLLNPLQPPMALNGLTWPMVLGQVFWINWLLVLVNLLPALPLDGGRVLRGLLWQQVGYRSAMQRVALTAKVTAAFAWILAWWIREDYPFAVLPLMLLGVFLFFSAKQESERQEREPEDGLFGYDFSQGYTSLEKNLEPAPRRRSPGPMRQWLENRREARLLRQQQAEEDDERRVDMVLARLHEGGIDSLSDDERALLDRVSARYRNRQRG